MFTRRQLVDRLREEVRRCEDAQRPRDLQAVSTGVPPLDRLLPGGGLRTGCLVEYLAAGPASGAGVLALLAAREVCRATGRKFIVLDRRRQFYSPAAAAWQIDLAQLLLLRPAGEAEERWALDQALRCPAIGAVWAHCESLPARESRRLQLAAESSGAVGVFVRKAPARAQPTWSAVQWLVTPQPSPDRWRLRVELARCRGGTGGSAALLELEETTGVWRAIDEHSSPHPVPVSAELAPRAPARRQSSA